MAGVPELARVTPYPVAECWNLDQLPFQVRDLGIHLWAGGFPTDPPDRKPELPAPLGPTHPCSNAVDVEPFLKLRRSTFSVE